MLPKEAIQEFIEIYFEDFGVILSYEEAEEMTTNILTLFKILLHKD